MDVMFQSIVRRIELMDFRKEPTLRSPYLLLLADRLLGIKGHHVQRYVSKYTVMTMSRLPQYGR